MSERIFNVSRSTKTGKTVNVGDFPTVEQAQAAMLSHYKVTPKRGDFRYRIFERASVSSFFNCPSSGRFDSSTSFSAMSRQSYSHGLLNCLS